MKFIDRIFKRLQASKSNAELEKLKRIEDSKIKIKNLETTLSIKK